MAPVTSDGVDRHVNELGQLTSTIATGALALAALVYVIVLWRRERIVWPAFMLVGGTLAFLLEPLFDHLYGLWFFEEGQWTLFSSHGSHLPAWLPLAYMAYYGGAAIVIARILQRRPQMRTVWQMYAGVVVMSYIAEISYIQVFAVYNYQDSQPFVVLGYPAFMAFTNAMSALVAGIIASRIAPLLSGRNLLSLVTLTPLAYGAGLFGTGILYLSVRHSFEDPPMWLVHVAALTVPLAIAMTVRLAGKIFVTGEWAGPGGRP